MATDPTTEPTPLQTDAELAQSLDAATERYNAFHRPAGAVLVGCILLASLALPMLLLASPANIIVAIALSAGTGIALGAVKGRFEYNARTKALDCFSEQQAREKDPLRLTKALGEAYTRAVTGGVKEDITVKKPLQLKKAPAP